MARRPRARRLSGAARAAVRGRAVRAGESPGVRTGPADGHRRSGQRPLQRHQPLTAHRHGLRRQLRRQLRQRPAAPRLGLPGRHGRARWTGVRDRRAGRRRRGFAGRPLGGAVRRPRRRDAASRRRTVGPRGPRLSPAPARAASPVRGRRHRSGRRARRALRRHRQQSRPVHRPRRPRRRDGREASQGAGPGRARRPPAADRRPGAARVHRLRGREADQGEPDHFHGAARVRHVGARQRARPGRRTAHAQPPREPVRGRRRHLRRGAQA